MANIMFISKVAGGYQLEDCNGDCHGIADSMAEAVQSAKDHVEVGTCDSYCIAD